MLKTSPKDLRDRFVLESPQSANVESKVLVLRELVQRWCDSRIIFFFQKPPMEIAAVSTTGGDSDAIVSALGWYGSWQDKGHGNGFFSDGWVFLCTYDILKTCSMLVLV